MTELHAEEAVSDPVASESGQIFDLIYKVAHSRELRAKPAVYMEPIHQLGLERYVQELDNFGYTVIPPDVVGVSDRLDVLRGALLRVASERTGVRQTMDRAEVGSPHPLVQATGPGQYLLHYLLLEDPDLAAFTMNDVVQAMNGYAFRNDFQLSALQAFVKWKGGSYGPGFGLHTDASGSPEGLLPTAWQSTCNATLTLSEYTKEDGALAVVPGSHLRCRQPRGDDGVSEAVPVEAAPGSLIFWYGNTWHGAFPKLTDGLRLNLVLYTCSTVFRPLESYLEKVTREHVSQGGELFAHFIGLDTMLVSLDLRPRIREVISDLDRSKLEGWIALESIMTGG